MNHDDQMKKYKTKIAIFILLNSYSIQAASINGFEADFYGFIKASSMYSSEALGSYNNVNLSAPTHAVAQTKPYDSTSRMSFQTQQSRIGFTLNKGKELQARLEFDFVDFSKSSPTVQMNPRVRIASITFKNEDYKFIVGQDWDLFSPVTSFTFDYVGLYFMAGNTGFMRQQFQYIKNSGDWEYGTAIGMAGANPGTTDADLELAKSPSYAARITYALEKGRIGLSGIYGNLKYLSNNSRHDSYGANVFFEKIMASTSIKSEAYYGQNLANMGTLSIGKGNELNDVREFGGTFTIQQVLNAQDSIFGGAGIAKIDNSTELVPFSMSAANLVTSPGIRSNFVSRVGWERKLTPDFSWISEFSRYETKSRVASHNQLNLAYGIESGFVLKF